MGATPVPAGPGTAPQGVGIARIWCDTGANLGAARQICIMVNELSHALLCKMHKMSGHAAVWKPGCVLQEPHQAKLAHLRAQYEAQVHGQEFNGALVAQSVQQGGDRVHLVKANSPCSIDAFFAIEGAQACFAVFWLTAPALALAGRSRSSHAFWSGNMLAKSCRLIRS